MTLKTFSLRIAKGKKGREYCCWSPATMSSPMARNNAVTESQLMCALFFFLPSHDLITNRSDSEYL